MPTTLIPSLPSPSLTRIRPSTLTLPRPCTTMRRGLTTSHAVLQGKSLSSTLPGRRCGLRFLQARCMARCWRLAYISSPATRTWDSRSMYPRFRGWLPRLKPGQMKPTVLEERREWLLVLETRAPPSGWAVEWPEVWEGDGDGGRMVRSNSTGTQYWPVSSAMVKGSIFCLRVRRESQVSTAKVQKAWTSVLNSVWRLGERRGERWRCTSSVCRC
ncbi:hypothetical protein F5Y18DRAFT_304378 [Xylariaceae sp. FL1019]|nr:hypothetical protein F5Y18DRAFT_304378 [Xylariaceae sp. FL1019]